VRRGGETGKKSPRKRSERPGGKVEKKKRKLGPATGARRCDSRILQGHDKKKEVECDGIALRFGNSIIYFGKFENGFG